MTNSFVQVDQDVVRPRVVIVDDDHPEVVLLEGHLKRTGYHTEWFENAKAASEYLQKHLAHVLLIDVSLFGAGRDIDGIRFAEECALKFPDSARICISRETVVRVQPDAIIEAMNPTGALAKRSIWAFGEKSRPQSIIDLISLVRRQTVCTDTVRICVDQPLHEEWKANFSRLSNRGSDVELDRQFIEVVKQIARRAFMPEVEEIRLEKVGKGRSRTVVARMTVTFKNEHSPLRWIVKVGMADLIAKEIENYARYVPRLLGHGQYPSLEGQGQSRDFAGVAYGLIGRPGNELLPPTLGDLFAKATISEPKRLELIRSAFRSLAPVEPPSEALQLRTLKEDLGERFRELQNPIGLETEFKKSMEILARPDMTLVATQGEGFKLRMHGNRQLSHLKDLLKGRVAYERYEEAVVHGDFHPDNIVFSSEAAERFLVIDFAHTGRHTVFLDHVVFELGLRLQFLSALPQDVRNGDVKQLYGALISLESALCDILLPGKRTEPPPSLPGFSALYNSICVTRATAAARWPREPADRYLAVAGLAFAAALRLKMTESTDPRWRVWMSVSAALNLTAYENMQKAEPRHGAQPNLWSYGQETSDQDRLHESLYAHERDLERLLLQAVRQVAADGTGVRDLSNRVSGVVDKVDVLTEHFPRVIQTLDDLIGRLKGSLNSDEQLILSSIGRRTLLSKLPDLMPREFLGALVDAAGSNKSRTGETVIIPESDRLLSKLPDLMPREFAGARVDTVGSDKSAESRTRETVIGPESDRLDPKIDVDPFYESPLLNLYSQSIDRKAFSNIRCFCLLHFLRDLVPFAMALTRAGVRPEHCTFFYKTYPYPQRDAIREWLRGQGFTVAPVSDIDEHLTIENQGGSTEPIVIVEDGGLLTPGILSTYVNICRRVRLVVEQTNRGAWNINDALFRRGGPAPFTVLSVAGCKAKSVVEPPYIAGSFVSAMQRYYPDQLLKGTHVGVVGYGNIGKLVAERLRREDAVVTVFDTDGLKMQDARNGGYTTARDVNDLVKQKIWIVGTTGHLSITEAQIPFIAHNAHLVSSSSEQHEFAVEEFGKRCDTKAEFNRGRLVGTRYSLKGPNQKEFVLVANGYPLNFWGVESMPPALGDWIMAILFLSAIDGLAVEPPPAKPSSEEVDRIVDRRKVLDEFNLVHTPVR